MSRVKKPRNKPHRPGRSFVTSAGDLLKRSSIEHAIRQNYHVSLAADQQRDIAIFYGIAIEAFAQGKGNADHLSAIACMCNHALVLCERNFGEEFHADVAAAVDGVWRAQNRADNGRYGFDGVGLTAVRRAFDVHIAQVEVCGQGHLMAAGREVHERLVIEHVKNEAARVGG